MSGQGRDDNANELAQWAAMATDPAARQLFARHAETAYTGMAGYRAG